MKRDVEFPKNPPKLVEMDHPSAEILAQGNRQYAASPAENERMVRMRPGRIPRLRSGSTLRPVITVVAALLVALALGALAHSQLVSRRQTPNAAPSNTVR